MKKLLSIIFLGIAITLGSCKCEDPVQPLTDSNLHIKFETLYDRKPLVENQEIYEHADGSMYSISLFRYYISHITLIDADGNEFNTKGYDLVDAFDPTYQDANFKIPKTHYRYIRFYIGIPQPQNSQSSTEGELNIALGMTWNWTFGYIFFKHEGTFTSADQSAKGKLSYHLGTDTTLRTVKIPIAFDVDQDQEELTLSLDIRYLYQGGKAVDFLKKPTAHSDPSKDLEWMYNTANLLSYSFEATWKR